jgi:hypothetical protein
MPISGPSYLPDLLDNRNLITWSGKTNFQLGFLSSNDDVTGLDVKKAFPPEPTDREVYM